MTGAAGQIAYSLLYGIAKGDVFGKDQVEAGFGLCSGSSHPIKHCCVIQHVVWLIPGISTMYVWQTPDEIISWVQVIYCHIYASHTLMFSFPLSLAACFASAGHHSHVACAGGCRYGATGLCPPTSERYTHTVERVSWGPVFSSLCASLAVFKACVFIAQMTRAQNSLIGWPYDPQLKGQLK